MANENSTIEIDYESDRITHFDILTTECIRLANKRLAEIEEEPDKPQYGGAMRIKCSNPPPGYLYPDKQRFLTNTPDHYVRPHEVQGLLYLECVPLDKSDQRYNPPKPAAGPVVRNPEAKLKSTFEKYLKGQGLECQRRKEWSHYEMHLEPDENLVTNYRANISLEGIRGWYSEKESFSCAGRAPWDLGSVNYLATGAPRIFVIIDREDTQKFEEKVLAKLKIAGRCTRAVSHLSVIPTFDFLNEHEIGFSILQQRAKDVVIILPLTYYFYFNTGTNCSENFNFIPRNWDPKASGYRCCTDPCLGQPKYQVLERANWQVLLANDQHEVENMPALVEDEARGMPISDHVEPADNSVTVDDLDDRVLARIELVKRQGNDYQKAMVQAVAQMWPLTLGSSAGPWGTL